jgi:hypothetical protein
MSELAFNANGETFELPASVTAWRVRRMKPRGAPELVYGSDGGPLTLPVDATIDDLRDAVGLAGKYRLDPLNDDGKFVESVPAAYVQVTRQPRNVEPTSGLVAPSIAPSEDTLREAMRLNTDLARSIVDKFPEMMHAAAELLRAADGAGLPRREPRSEREDVEDDDDEDEDEEAAPTSSVGIDINAIIAQVVPMLVMAFASGDKAKLPSLAEMLDWRKAVPKPKLQAAPIDVVSTASPTESNPTPATGDVMERVGLVLAELTPDERMLAISLAQELSPDERSAWFAELAPLSVADAVARLRKVLSSKKERVS